MPPELYLGAVAVVILIVLIASMFRRGAVPRRAAHKAVDTDQLVRHLSRIADALERLTSQSQASPSLAEQPPFAPRQKVPERVPEMVPETVAQADTEGRLDGKEEPPSQLVDKEEPSKPKQPHVSLSMFGR